MMSFSCHCPERKKPIEQRNWFVWQYKMRCSAFDGYHPMTSDYSTVYCRSCQALGRTKAAFVDELKRDPEMKP